MYVRLASFFLVSFGTFGVFAWSTLLEEDRLTKWEKDIAKIEARFQEKAPPKEGIAFAGSSSIVRWDVAKSFPDLPVYNCGFGGSIISDSTLFADRILIPHKPKMIVFYAGDNDIAGKRSPEQVLTDFEAFVAKIHKHLPKTKILFLSIKPSIARWKLAEQQKTANALVEAFCKKDDRLVYVDLFNKMLDKEGMPREDFFTKEDPLHVNSKGYDHWTEWLKPFLK